MASTIDKWIKRFIKETQKESDVTKEDLEQWLYYSYTHSMEYCMKTDLDLFFRNSHFFTCCYLTALKLLKKKSDISTETLI